MIAGRAGASLAAGAAAGPALLALILVPTGVGEGLIAPTVIGVALRHVPAADAGVATGCVLIATQVANCVGIALVGGVYTTFAESDPAVSAFQRSLVVAMMLAALTAVATLALPTEPTRDQQPATAS